MITENKTQFLSDELDQLRTQGLFRPLRVLGSPQDTEAVVDGRRVQRTGRYRVVRGSRVAFAVAAYDRARPLVIDPVLVYSTYLGGSDIDGVFQQHPTALDAAGALYVAGYTDSVNFPTAGALQSSSGGGFNTFLAPPHYFYNLDILPRRLDPV